VVAALLLMMPVLWQANLSVPSGGQLLASLAYIGIFASALGFWLWNRAVARVGPGRAAPYLYLMPLYGSLLSFVALGESVQGYQIAGGGLVLLGLWVARPRSVIVANLMTET
jgi:drug/metabolite transporter (DMT)-like permease